MSWEIFFTQIREFEKKGKVLKIRSGKRILGVTVREKGQGQGISKRLYQLCFEVRIYSQPRR